MSFEEIGLNPNKSCKSQRTWVLTLDESNEYFLANIEISLLFSSRAQTQMSIEWLGVAMITIPY